MSRTSPRLPGRSLARSRCDPRTAYSVGRISLAVGMRTLETERLLIRPFVPDDATEFKRLLDGAFGTGGYGSPHPTRLLLFYNVIAGRARDAPHPPPHENLGSAFWGGGTRVGSGGLAPSPA